MTTEKEMDERVKRGFSVVNQKTCLKTREFIKRMNLVITTPIFLRGYNEWCRNNGYSITVLTVNHYLSHFSQRLDIPVSELIEMRKDYEINYKTYFNHFNRYLTLSVYGEDTGISRRCEKCDR